MQNYRTKLFHKLTDNSSEGLYNLCIWLPLFASCWLVSGFIINKLDVFSYFFFPLISFFLFYTSKEQNEKTLEQKKYILVIVLVFLALYSAYLEHILDKNELTFSFIIAMLAFMLDWILSKSNIDSVFKVAVKSIIPVFLLCSFVFIGIFSQYDVPFQARHLSYLVLGLIPGFVLSSRVVLIHSTVLEKSGWKYESAVQTKKGEVVRPKGISRTIVGLMILGPAIPSLLMPFYVIPQTLFVVSLSFLLVPKLAQKIQTQAGTLEERIFLLTLFAMLVVVLTFSGASLA